MPKLSVEVRGELSGVSSIEAPDDYPYHLVIKCRNCEEESRTPVVVCMKDRVEGIRGASVHLKMTCRMCSRTNDMRLREALPYTSEDAPAWKTFLKVECRGLEPVRLHLADDAPLIIKGDSGFAFEDAFIQNGEFYSYDEEQQTEVSITEFETRVVRT